MATAVDVITKVNIKGNEAVFDFDADEVEDSRLRYALNVAQSTLSDFYTALGDIEELADEISDSST